MINADSAFSGFAVKDTEEARKFYGDTLGLRVEDSEYSEYLLNLHIGSGNPIVMYLKPDHQPAVFTILNFPVKAIETVVDDLISKGVTFEQYGGELQTDEKGICRNEHGPAIAWFRDPSGNILSLIEE